MTKLTIETTHGKFMIGSFDGWENEAELKLLLIKLVQDIDLEKYQWIKD